MARPHQNWKAALCDSDGDCGLGLPLLWSSFQMTTSLLQTPMANQEVADTQRPRSLGRCRNSEHPASSCGDGCGSPGLGGQRSQTPPTNSKGVSIISRLKPRAHRQWAIVQIPDHSLVGLGKSQGSRSLCKLMCYPGAQGPHTGALMGCLEGGLLGSGGEQHQYHQEVCLQGFGLGPKPE